MPDVDSFRLPEPELQADIYYLSESEGGRTSPVRNGYRGQFFYNGINWDAMQQFIDMTWCKPGESVTVYLKTAGPAFHAGQFYVGKQFEIREGSTTVGKGTITAVLRDSFKYWDGKTFLASLSSDIKPFSGDDLFGFRQDFYAYLADTKLFKDITIETADNPECMLLVRCTLSNKNIKTRLLAETVIDCWKNQLAFANNLYKVLLVYKHDNHTDWPTLDRFVLAFATWKSMYLTGQIIVTQ